MADVAPVVLSPADSEENVRLLTELVNDSDGLFVLDGLVPESVLMPREGCHALEAQDLMPRVKHNSSWSDRHFERRRVFFFAGDGWVFVSEVEY